MPLFAIIVAFTMANGHGEGVTDDRFSTLEECDQARPAMVEGFKAAMRRAHHDITITSSRCGLASELEGTPI